MKFIDNVVLYIEAIYQEVEHSLVAAIVLSGWRPYTICKQGVCVLMKGECVLLDECYLLSIE